jgi:endonuclease III
MEEEKSETASDTSINTAATTKSMMDRIDSLTQMVQLLAEKVHEVVENQEVTAQKRARSLETMSRQILNSSNRPTEKDATHSPLAKLPRPSARSKSPKPPPPPPNGMPNTAGTQEGS